MATYRSKFSMHSLSRKGHKPINFHPHDEGGGYFRTEDIETQRFIEGHMAFKEGFILRVSDRVPPPAFIRKKSFLERLWSRFQ